MKHYPKIFFVLSLLLLLSISNCQLSAQAVSHFDPTRAKRMVQYPAYQDTLGISRSEFIYLQTDVDTILDEAYDDYYILEAGDEFSKYEGYHSFRIDSSCTSLNWKLSYAQLDIFIDKFMDDVNEAQTPEFIYNFKNRSFTVTETFLLDSYIYKDSTAHFNWILSPNTTTVCGYLCRKAEATFRGIQWTVWYSPDIPLSIGPWKFNGLPGLVLWAYDDKGTHDIKLVAARKSSGKSITIQIKNRMRMKRERVNKQIEKFKIATVPYNSATGLPLHGIDKNGNPEPYPQVRRFYVPYELE